MLFSRGDSALQAGNEELSGHENGPRVANVFRTVGRQFLGRDLGPVPRQAVLSGSREKSLPVRARVSQAQTS